MAQVLERFPANIEWDGAAGSGSAASLADASDATVVTMNTGPMANPHGTGDLSSISTPTDHKLHRYRVLYRVRKVSGTNGTTRGRVILAASGTSEILQFVTWTSFAQGTGAWQFAHPTDQTGTIEPDFSLHATGDVAGEFAVSRLWGEFDYRAQPTFACVVKDKAGNTIAPEGVIADTRQPRIDLSAIERDGLNTNGYRVWITDDNDGDAEVWASDNTTSAVTSLTVAVGVGLPDGDYTAHAIVRSIVGASTVWASTEFTQKFTITADLVPVFTADVKDLTGTSKAAGTIQNTNRARFVFDGLDLKGYHAKDWEVKITNTATSEVVEVLSGNGAPPDPIMSSPLVNGPYTALLTMRSHDTGAYYEETSDSVSWVMNFATPDPNSPNPLVVSEVKFHVTALPRRRGEIL